jgi:hypothetical protein
VIVGSKATPPLIVEFEAAKRQGEYYKDRSFYVSVSNTEAEELRRRPALAQQMFDPGFKAIREARIRGQHVVLDLAANLDFTVADYFTALMGESDLGEGDEVVYLAVATAETPALQDAERGLRMIKKALPNSTAIAVVNDWLPNIRCEPGSEKFTAFSRRAAAAGAAETIYLAGLMAEDMMTHAKASKTSIDELATLTSAQISEVTGIDVNDAIRSRRALLLHLKDLVPVLERNAIIAIG